MSICFTRVWRAQDLNYRNEHIFRIFQENMLLRSFLNPGSKIRIPRKSLKKHIVYAGKHHPRMRFSWTWGFSSKMGICHIGNTHGPYQPSGFQVRNSHCALASSLTLLFTSRSTVLYSCSIWTWLLSLSRAVQWLNLKLMQLLVANQNISHDQIQWMKWSTIMTSFKMMKWL